MNIKLKTGQKGFTVHEVYGILLLLGRLRGNNIWVAWSLISEPGWVATEVEGLVARKTQLNFRPFWILVPKEPLPEKQNNEVTSALSPTSS